jgi:hypothetical protein
LSFSELVTYNRRLPGMREPVPGHHGFIGIRKAFVILPAENAIESDWASQQLDHRMPGHQGVGEPAAMMNGSPNCARCALDDRNKGNDA